MPALKKSLESKLNEFVLTYPKSFENVHGKLFCRHCSKTFDFTHQHVSSNGLVHLKNKQTNSVQSSIVQSMEKRQESPQVKQYSQDITKWMSENDIPFNKLKEDKFTWIFKKYIKEQRVPSGKSLREKYLPLQYDLIISRIREIVGNKPFYLVVDETSDKLNRYVLNILVGSLNGISYSKPMLLMCQFLEEANHKSVQRAIFDSLCLLFKGKIIYDNFYLLLTDMGYYMLIAGDNLRELGN
jgi:hypothetical protein